MNPLELFQILDESGVFMFWRTQILLLSLALFCALGIALSHWMKLDK